MIGSIFLQIPSAFGAGVLTSLSPCVYPMIPITVGFLGSGTASPAASRARILGFFAGQVIAFVLLGVSAVMLGEIFGFSSEIPSVKIIVGLLFILLAYYSARNRLPGFLYRLNSLQVNSRPTTWVSAVIVGISSAAVVSPCSSPVLGGVLAAISQLHSLGRGVVLMSSYAIGMSIVFLVIGLGIAKANKIPRAGNWMRRVHQLSNLALGGVGIFFLWQGFTLL